MVMNPRATFFDECIHFGVVTASKTFKHYSYIVSCRCLLIVRVLAAYQEYKREIGPYPNHSLKIISLFSNIDFIVSVSTIKTSLGATIE